MLTSIIYIFNMLTISRSWLFMVDDTGTIGWRRPWRLVKFWCVTSARMFFNEGGDVISCALKCLAASMCVTSPRFMTSSSWRRRTRTLATRSRRPMILLWSDTSWCHRPPWPTSSNCPCHPQWHQPPTHMTFILSCWQYKQLWCQPSSPQHTTS